MSATNTSNLPWEIRLKRNGNYHPLIDYIVLAEFDIDSGTYR